MITTQKPAPDGNGAFSFFNSPIMNDAGEVGFFGFLNGTSGGNSDDSGIFSSSGGLVNQIVREGQSVPDGNGTFSGFGSISFNQHGTAAFTASLLGTSGGSSDNLGIYAGSGGTITQIARRGTPPPVGSGTFLSLSAPVINNHGWAAFHASLTGTSGGTTDDTGVYLGNGNSTIQIAREGGAVPDGNGVYSVFHQQVAINDLGMVAINVALSGTSGGAADNAGLYRGSVGGMIQIARKGQLVPDGNGTLASFTQTPAMNESGTIAFHSQLAGTSGGTSDNVAIFRGNGGALTQVVRTGQLVPDGNGTYSALGSPVINNHNDVAFFASLTGTAGGSSDNSGIFRNRGGLNAQVVRAGQAAPDGNGVFSVFSTPALNDSGTLAFIAQMGATAGGSSDNLGLFLGDGVDLIQAVRTGQSLDGSTIVDVFTSLGGAVGSVRSGFNRHGQVAYTAFLANGESVIDRFTPDLHWRQAFSGNWDSVSVWTLGLRPGEPHDVYIDPSGSLTVTGSSQDTTVRSLRVGGGNGVATLRLVNGANLTATHAMVIEDKGILRGDGVVTANFLTNFGVVEAENLTVQGTFQNSGEIRGNGRIDVYGSYLNYGLLRGNVRLEATAGIFNDATSGEIRVAHGERMRFAGLFNPFDNEGRIEIHGGELQIDGPVHNAANTGLITLRDGTLRVNSGSVNSGLTNHGGIGISFGTSDVFGQITNASTGVINVSGGANVTFYDDLAQNGTLQVAKVGNTSSTAVIFGAFSGTGGFTGGGDVFALGDLRPGASPSVVVYDGNLFLGNASGTFIELGGLTPGAFDQMIVTGDLHLAGDLDIALIDNHRLRLNRRYEIGLVGGTLTGLFNGLGEGDRVGTFGGKELFISYAAGGGNGITLFTAIPEPNVWCLCAAAALVFIGWRRQPRLPASTL